MNQSYLIEETESNKNYLQKRNITKLEKLAKEAAEKELSYGQLMTLRYKECGKYV